MTQLPGIDYPCLEGHGKCNDILDHMYDTIDDMLIDGKFEEVDDLLNRVNVEQLSITLMLGYLTITLPWRSLSKCRAALYARIDARLREIDPARRESLLRGLE